MVDAFKKDKKDNTSELINQAGATGEKGKIYQEKIDAIMKKKNEREAKLKKEREEVRQIMQDMGEFDGIPEDQ